MIDFYGPDKRISIERKWGNFDWYPLQQVSALLIGEKGVLGYYVGNNFTAL